jgi:IPT/TIG domain
MKSFCILLLTLFSLGCGYGSNYNSMPGTGNGSTPQISQLAPASTAAGGAGFILTVNGSGFGSGSVVYWNAAARSTTFVTGNQVTATIPASDIANSGTATVYVHSGAYNSNMMNFTVN